MTGTRRRPIVYRFDVILAAALLVVAEVELLASSAKFDRAMATVCAVAITVPIAFRRSSPLVVLATVLGANVVHLAVTGHPAPALADPPNSFALASAWLIAVYSVAAYGRRVEALIGLVLASATTAVFLRSAPGSPTVNDYLAVGLLSVAAPWLAGLARALQTARIDARREAERLRFDRERVEAEASAGERARIARDLHDIVAHGLSVMVVQASAERRQLADPNGETAEVLSTIEDTGRESLAELRRLLGVIRAGDDAPLAPQPRVADVGDLVAAVRNDGRDATLHVEGPAYELPPGIEVSAYRVTQEALTNVLKHSGASQVDVTLRYEPAWFEVEISDNGTGDTWAPAGGHGLRGARERVALFGGTLRAGVAAPGGFQVVAQFPVPRLA